MKKTVKGVMIMCMTFSLGTLFGCIGNPTGERGNNGAGEKAISNESGIVAITYDYIGSIGADSYSYSISKEGDKYYFYFEGMQYSEYGEMKTEFGEEDIEKINKLYLDMHIASWDGFDKYNSQVRDGYGFSLRISFVDGKNLRAHGSNAFPENYRAFVAALGEIIKPYQNSVIEEGKRKLIEKGVSGEITSALVSFQQQGKSGRDYYKFILYTGDIREDNFDVTIKSDSGKYFEKGEYFYYTALPDDEIGLGKLKELAEKYDLIQWYDYYKVSDDPNNSEWFQIALSFEDGKIHASGTLHPENYDEFRDEFLELMAETVENAKINHGLKVYEN